jgi:hypothetical protein
VTRPDAWESILASAVRNGLPQFGSLLAIEPLGAQSHALSQSRTLILRFEQQSIHAFLKLYQRRDQPEPLRSRDWAEKEFGLLGALWNKAPGLGLRTVEPLLHVPEIDAVLLRYQPGELLSSHLRRARLRHRFSSRSAETLAGHLGRLGQALRSFQGLSRQDPNLAAWIGQHRSNANLQRLLQVGDDQFHAAQSLLAPELRQRMDQVYAAAREGMVAESEPAPEWVGVHGDFTPVNVIVAGDELFLIDFVNTHLGHPHEDASRLVSYLAYQTRPPLGIPAALVNRLIRQFMAGLGAVDWQSSRSFLYLYQRSMCRTLNAGLRYNDKRWPMRHIYRSAMLRFFHDWVASGMRLPATD